MGEHALLPASLILLCTIVDLKSLSATFIPATRIWVTPVGRDFFLKALPITQGSHLSSRTKYMPLTKCPSLCVFPFHHMSLLVVKESEKRAAFPDFESPQFTAGIAFNNIIKLPHGGHRQNVWSLFPITGTQVHSIAIKFGPCMRERIV